ncbi:MAG: DUF5808 domain-containing protein [Bryobacteraceae bacterium]
MRLILCGFQVLMGALLFAVPHMTRRELLFAVPVPADFRRTQAGRSAIAVFRVVVMAALLTSVAALLFLPDEFMAMAATSAPIVLMMAGGAAFYLQYRKLAPSAIQFAGRHEAELTDAPEELPRFVWFAAGPFVMLGAAAIWMSQNWDRIPARFPVHFGFDGQPNRWAERTTRGVYGAVLFGAELCAWLLILGLAGWFGSRRSVTRSVMLGGMIGMGYFAALLFALISLQAPLGLPTWVPMVAPLAILIPLLIVMVRKMSDPQDPVDATPNECWKVGIIYYNPNDAVLFVQKRDGLGYTFNFANRWAWVLLAGLVMVMASAQFVIG